jgi:hypothetical protein
MEEEALEFRSLFLGREGYFFSRAWRGVSSEQLAESRKQGPRYRSIWLRGDFVNRLSCATSPKRDMDFEIDGCKVRKV